MKYNMYSLKNLFQGAIKQFSLKVTNTLTNPNQTSMKLQKNFKHKQQTTETTLYLYNLYSNQTILVTSNQFYSTILF